MYDSLKAFSGVLATFSDSQDIISISGPIENVNAQIPFITFAEVMNPSEIECRIRISDTINPDFEGVFNLSDLAFLKYNDRVKVNS